jgi:hypothetical protein
MPVRRKQYWRVSLGLKHKYFADEADARDYARDRANDPENWDGLPFVDVIDEREVLVILNNLSAMEQ